MVSSFGHHHQNNLIKCHQTNSKSNTNNINKPTPAHLVFPGGGIFFYWQAGTITYLREKGYDLSKVSLTGASAGALTATLTAANVNFEEATELALSLAKDAEVWDRTFGLYGIWGEYS